MPSTTTVTQAESHDAERQILLFGDLSLIQFEESFRRILHVKTNALLTSFIDRVNYSLRRLLETLPLEQQVFFPRFTTLIDLVSKLGETEGTPVLRFFLLSVHEVAQFLVHYGSGSKPFPSPANTYVLGPCTGGFAAAAISCSKGLPDVVPHGVAACMTAFKTALCSYLVGRSQSRVQATESKSWSVILNPQKDVEVEDLLKDYMPNQAALRNLPIWVSAAGKSTTLSGRPAILQDFITKNASRVKSSRYLDVESPYHAAHLFNDDDVEEIVGDLVEAENRAVNFPFIASSTGKVISTGSLVDLLRTVVQEALEEPVRWDLVLASCRDLFSSSKECTILPFSSHAASMISSTLDKDGVQVTVEEITAPVTGQVPTEPTGKFEHSKIAIIGYSGRFPNSASTEAFWDLLKNGRDVHKEIPADRFDWKSHYDPAGKKKNTSRVKFGCFIDEPGVFDTRFFNMSPREAENTDPAQRLAITTTYEAMEMSGMVLNRTASTQQDRVGVFFGTTSDDWREVNSGQDIGTYFIPGGNRAFVPGRISYFFRFSGPSLSVDTACSSSFAAIQAACSYLWRGDVDTAVAGGTNILTNPDNFAGLDRGHFLSTTGNCNAFDDGASGYCRSDAVGSVILKRVEDAIADKDPIFGVIVGTNTNHCGQTDSITRPHEGDQTSVFKRIMRNANVDPLDVNYIEMHGTGTQAGDATEMKSVLSTFMPKSKNRSESPMHLGSAKANIGHAESASGVTSLIKVLLMMKNSEIPPHVGIKTKINHTYPTDLAERGVKIAMKRTPWIRSEMRNGKRAAFLNNFSAAGGNTAILLEDAPILERAICEADRRPAHVVTVTAKSPKAIAANINSLISFLEKNPSVELPALSYTTTARRMQHNYRVLLSASNTESLSSSLKAIKAADIKPIAKKPTSVVFAFSGQGTLFVGIGKTLFDTNASFRSRILELNRIAENQGFPSFIGHIDATTSIPKTEVASQLALVCIQIALADLWRTWGILPAAVIGHSLGEYAALYAAGVLSVVDAVYLVGARATLLEKRCTVGTHSMLVVRAPMEEVVRLLERTADGKGKCEVACANQPTQIVVAGPVEKIVEVARVAAESGVEAIRLDVPFAFHSTQVDPILEEFEQVAAQGVTYNAPTVPVMSPLLSKVVPAGEEGTLNGSYLAAACRGMVDFVGALSVAGQADEVLVTERAIWLEIGPASVCGGMIKGTVGSQCKTVPSLRKGAEAYDTLAAALKTLYLAGVDINWNEYHRDFPAAQQMVDLPRYSWDLNNYWIQYKHGFCLTKGDAPVVQQKTIEAPAPAPQVAAKYISPCAQQVIEESNGADRSSLVIQSDIYDPRLISVLHDHRVNGAALCPSSMWADVALTMANYMAENSPMGLDIASTGFDVANVVVDKPLLAVSTETSKCFRATAETKWSSNTIAIEIFSVDSNGKRGVTHCKIDVQVTPQQKWLNEWKRNAHFVTSRIDALTESKDSHNIRRGMAYKLFGALVEYSKEYQGMSSVVLNSKNLEAVSTVEFQVGKQGFHLNPKWIDSLGHIAGFIMNANDDVDSRTTAFINHGWERMRIAEPFEEGKKYRVYNRMQLVEKSTYTGDTYILDGDRIVAVFEGVTFGGVPRRVLDHFFPTLNPTAATTKPAVTKAPAPAPAPVKAAKQAKAAVQAPVSQPSAKAKAARSNTPSVVSRILAVICEEIGVSPSDLTAESEFADFGIDSLLSLTIVSKIREVLGLDFASTLFVDHPTVGDLQVLAGGEINDPDTTGCSSDDESEDTAPTTATSVTSEDVEPLKDESAGTSRTGVALTMREIITEETGVAMEDLTSSSALADMGVDSLLSLTIVAKVQERLNVDMPGFMEFETLQDVENSLFASLGLNAPAPAAAATPVSKPKATQQVSKPAQPKSGALPKASSILLSGSPKTAELIFFLFPDGSGSASSYAAVAPAIDPTKVAVYGLNCPWRKTGAEMTRLGINMETMVTQYVDELRRLLTPHSHVPFALGGWSAGGILALEAARQLKTQHSLHPAKLVLLDSPNPIGLQNPPKRMYDFFDQLGIFGEGGKTPDWLRAHFDAFIRILDEYEPKPLADSPNTLIVYAKDGVCKDPNGPKMEIRPDDPREMIWLLNNRTDFEAGGWKSVVGQDKLSVAVVDEVNHFTIMDQGDSRRVGESIARFFNVRC